MARGSVLIVHDDANRAAPIMAAAQAVSLSYSYADSIQEAVDQFKANQPQMVIAWHQLKAKSSSASDTPASTLFAALTAMDLDPVPLLQIGGGESCGQIITALESGMDDIMSSQQLSHVLPKRLAFWVVSDFKGLPNDLRRRAASALKADLDAENFKSYEDRLALNTALMDTAAAVIEQELHHAGADFGERYIERAALLARLSYLLIKDSKDFADYFHFPDMIFGIARKLKAPWTGQIHSLLSQFDDLVAKDSFALAAQKPLIDSVIKS